MLHNQEDQVMLHNQEDLVMLHNLKDQVMLHNQEDQVMLHNQEDLVMLHNLKDQVMLHNQEDQVMFHNQEDLVMSCYTIKRINQVMFHKNVEIRKVGFGFATFTKLQSNKISSLYKGSPRTHKPITLRW